MTEPYFIFRGYDDPTNANTLRAQLRSDHRVYIRETRHGVRVIAGGMVVTDADDGVTGTMLILQGPDRASVMRYLAGDPYWDAGLFARVEVDRWSWGLNPPTDAQMRPPEDFNSPAQR